MVELLEETADGSTKFNFLKAGTPEKCREAGVFFIQYACQFEEEVGHR